MKFPIPIEAFDDRLAILGMSGSGKTYLTLSALERLLKMSARAVCVDPLGVMWGIRLKADGVTPSGFNVPIFGGRHGDLPLNEHAGALIGETVATMHESCIVDLSELPTKSAERRFMTAFLDAAFRYTDPARVEPYHLIIDEADRFAPQKPPAGDETMLNRMEEIVRRGRARGFIPWLVTQRPAVLNKNVLSQADGLVMLKLTSSQDREQVGAWIEGQADRAQGKAILGSLPTMQRGQGVIWIPGRGILETVQFPPKETYDSSSAPKRGEKRRAAELKPLDLAALKDRLSAIEAETKANDPKTLKAEIARLKADIANRRTQDAGKGQHQAELLEAFERGEKQGRDEGWSAGYAKAKAAAIVAAVDATAALRRAADDSPSDIRTAIESMRPPAVPKGTAAPVITNDHQRSSTYTKPGPPVYAAPEARSKPAGRANGSDSGLTNPQNHLLEALAWWAALGHESPTRAQVSGKARWKVGGSNLRGRLAELSSAGLIRYPDANTVALTKEGAAITPQPDMSETLIDSVRAMLTNPQRQVFDELRQGREAKKRDDIAAALNWEPGGSNLRGRFAELSTLELIEYPSRGEVALQDWVR